MKKANTKALATTALLIAVEIILTRFFSIQTPTIRIGFGFLPISIIAMLYGPVYAGIGAAVADFLGATLFTTAAFFPGFTLTAILTGAVYGIFLHNRPQNIIRVSIAVIIIAVCFDLGLNTLWLQFITGKGYLALLPARVTKTLILIPIQIILIRLIVNKKVLLRVTQ